MSGRKKSEVINLLNLSDNIRNEINGYIENDIDNNISILNSLVNSMERDLNEIEDLSKEIEEFDGEDFQEIKNEFYELKKEVRNIDYTVEFSKYRNEKDDIKNQELKLIHEKNKIQESMRYKSDYVDEEFNRGEILLNEMEKLKNKKIYLKSQLDKEKSNKNSFANKIKTSKKKLTKLIDTSKVINASNLEESIKTLFNEINLENANLFLKNEYNDLKEKVENLYEKDAKFINENGRELQSILTSFINNLEEKVNIYENKKKLVEYNLSTIDEKVKKSFVNYSSFLISTNENYSLLEYYDEIKKENYNNKFNETYNEIKNYLNNREIDKAVELSEKLSENVENIYHYILSEHEKNSTNTMRAQEIVKVMDSKAFEVTVELINGNAMNGYQITSKKGDEIIEFDVYTTEEGPVVNLNHHESENNCGNTMKSIYNDLRNNAGIKDILKNGSSVIFPGNHTSTSKKKTEADKIVANTNIK